MVDDLNNGGEAALVDTLVEEDYTADLDQPPGARCDVGVTHFVGCAVMLIRSSKRAWEVSQAYRKGCAVVSSRSLVLDVGSGIWSV